MKREASEGRLPACCNPQLNLFNVIHHGGEGSLNFFVGCFSAFRFHGVPGENGVLPGIPDLTPFTEKRACRSSFIGFNDGEDRIFVDLLEIFGFRISFGLHIFQNFAAGLEEVHSIFGVNDFFDHLFGDGHFGGIIFDAGIDREAPATLPVFKRLAVDSQLVDRTNHEVFAVIRETGEFCAVPGAAEQNHAALAAGESIINIAPACVGIEEGGFSVGIEFPIIIKGREKLLLFLGQISPILAQISEKLSFFFAVFAEQFDVGGVGRRNTIPGVENRQQNSFRIFNFAQFDGLFQINLGFFGVLRVDEIDQRFNVEGEGEILILNFEVTADAFVKGFKIFPAADLFNEFFRVNCGKRFTVCQTIEAVGRNREQIRDIGVRSIGLVQGIQMFESADFDLSDFDVRIFVADAFCGGLVVVHPAFFGLD